jgi:Flp pilus assembly protein TadG
MSRRGHALVLATMSLFVMFGVVGLAVDLGWGYFRRQVAQTAADAASLAAAVVANKAAATIVCGQNRVVCQAATACAANIVTPANNIENGCLYAKVNGFQNSGNQTVTMASSAASGTIDPTVYTNLYTVTATVTETNAQLFSGVNGHPFGQVAATATAQVVQLPMPGCIIALNTTAAPALSVSGSNSSINAPGCGVIVNSNSSDALDVNGNATITAGYVKVVGSDVIGGQSTISPTPIVHAASTADPLASLGSPAPPTGCTQAGVNYSNQNMVATIASGTTCGLVSITGQNAHITMNPGYYCGGINIGGQSVVTMNAGVYYVCGGGFTVSGSGTNVTGTGVTIFNSGNHSVGSASYAPFTLTGQPNVVLAAPTTGPYANVLFYKDRAVVSAATETINGSTQPNLTGTIYLPGAKLLLTGGVSTGPNNPAVISDTIQVNGGGAIVNSSAGGSSTKFVALTQ